MLSLIAFCLSYSPCDAYKFDRTYRHKRSHLSLIVFHLYFNDKGSHLSPHLRNTHPNQSQTFHSFPILVSTKSFTLNALASITSSADSIAGKCNHSMFHSLRHQMTVHGSCNQCVTVCEAPLFTLPRLS
eukprot:84875_1